jgi:hypothetical protein
MDTQKHRMHKICCRYFFSLYIYFSQYLLSSYLFSEFYIDFFLRKSVLKVNVTSLISVDYTLWLRCCRSQVVATNDGWPPGGERGSWWARGAAKTTIDSIDACAQGLD